VALPACRAAETDYYMDPADVDLNQILAPPPKPDSAAGKDDLAAVLEAQRTRDQKEIDNAKADQDLSVLRFADVIGPGFKKENLPFAMIFFDHVRTDDENAISAAKKYFGRERPFQVDPNDVHPVVDKPSSASYPSGHSTFAYVNAIIVADMLPEKKEAIFERAGEYAHERVIGGVHFPTDIEAGRISASVIDNVLLHHQHFVDDYNRARGEVRRAAGLQ
jgi:acid phosphatase (class A)